MRAVYGAGRLRSSFLLAIRFFGMIGCHECTLTAVHIRVHRDRIGVQPRPATHRSDLLRGAAGYAGREGADSHFRQCRGYPPGQYGVFERSGGTAARDATLRRSSGRCCKGSYGRYGGVYGEFRLWAGLPISFTRSTANSVGANRSMPAQTRDNGVVKEGRQTGLGGCQECH